MLYFPTNGTIGMANGYFRILGRKRNSDGSFAANYAELTMSHGDTLMNTHLTLDNGYNLTVKGNTTISGATSLQGVSATTINATNLNLSGDLGVRGKGVINNAVLGTLQTTARTCFSSIESTSISGIRNIINNTTDYPRGMYPCQYGAVLHHYIRYKEDKTSRPGDVKIGKLYGLLFLFPSSIIMLGFSGNKICVHVY